MESETKRRTKMARGSIRLKWPPQVATEEPAATIDREDNATGPRHVLGLLSSSPTVSPYVSCLSSLPPSHQQCFDFCLDLLYSFSSFSPFSCFEVLCWSLKFQPPAYIICREISSWDVTVVSWTEIPCHDKTKLSLSSLSVCMFVYAHWSVCVCVLHETVSPSYSKTGIAESQPISTEDRCVEISVALVINFQKLGPLE